MHTLLTQASDALSRNDFEALESLCAQAGAAAHAQVSTEDRAALAAALLVFKRQVLSARSNLILRERLLATHAGGGTPWER